MTSPRPLQGSVESIDNKHSMLRRLVGQLGDSLTDRSSMPATLPTLIGSRDQTAQSPKGVGR